MKPPKDDNEERRLMIKPSSFMKTAARLSPTETGVFVIVLSYMLYIGGKMTPEQCSKLRVKVGKLRGDHVDNLLAFDRVIDTLSTDENGDFHHSQLDKQLSYEQFPQDIYNIKGEHLSTLKESSNTVKEFSEFDILALVEQAASLAVQGVRFEASEPDSETGSLMVVAPDAAPEEPDFDFWWNLYGRKIDRQYCLRKWSKLTRDERLAIVRHTTLYIQSSFVTGEIPARKHPKTYLNGRCWEDEGLLTVNYEKPKTKHGSEGRGASSAHDAAQRTADYFARKRAGGTN